MGRELGRWQKGNWGRDDWDSNKAMGTRQRDSSGRQVGPCEAKGPHVSGVIADVSLQKLKSFCLRHVGPSGITAWVAAHNDTGGSANRCCTLIHNEDFKLFTN